jgi:hypothetical protein
MVANVWLLLAAANCVQVQDAAVPQALCLQAQHLLLCTLRGRAEVSATCQLAAAAAAAEASWHLSSGNRRTISSSAWLASKKQQHVHNQVQN